MYRYHNMSREGVPEEHALQKIKLQAQKEAKHNVTCLGVQALPGINFRARRTNEDIMLEVLTRLSDVDSAGILQPTGALSLEFPDCASRS
jgi:hypothetical protein